MRVIGAGVTTHPTSLLSIGIDYYVYTAEESDRFLAGLKRLRNPLWERNWISAQGLLTPII